MKEAPLPNDESDRLQELYRYEVLDTEPEKDLDDLTLLAAQICETPIALVSLVDAVIGLSAFRPAPRMSGKCG